MIFWFSSLFDKASIRFTLTFSYTTEQSFKVTCFPLCSLLLIKPASSSIAIFEQTLVIGELSFFDISYIERLLTERSLKISSLPGFAKALDIFNMLSSFFKSSARIFSITKI